MVTSPIRWCSFLVIWFSENLPLLVTALIIFTIKTKLTSWRKVSPTRTTQGNANKMFENTQITTLNPPRPGKKLLVLDIDRTIADFHAGAPKREFKTRPYLHSFLSNLYNYYDIVIWSGTESDLLLKKLHSLGMWQNINFRLMACLDVTHMRVRTISAGPAILTKPLQVLWDEYPQYDFTNTIIIDDKVDNLYFNRRNGLLVTPYTFNDYANDNELYYLTTYLENLAQYCDDFSSINHRLWPYYQPETEN